MDKVIVERPRLGSGRRGNPIKGYKKKMQKEPLENRAKGESMTAAYGYDRKQLNEHLSPLKRYIKSKIGCKWDAVYSEICSRLKVDSAVQAHVRDHAEQMVAKNVLVINKKIYDAKYSPVYSGRYYNCFYVDPNTGILKEMPKESRSLWTWKEDRPFEDQFVIDRLNRLVLLKEKSGEKIWYHVTFKDIPPKPESTWVEDEMGGHKTLPQYPTDIILKKPATPEWSGLLSFSTLTITTWGSNIYACQKRQLGKREIKKLAKLLKERSVKA